VYKRQVLIPRFILPLSILFYLLTFRSFSSSKSLLVFFILILLWIAPYIKINFNNFYGYRKAPTSNTEILLLPPWENFYLKNNFKKNDLSRISKNYNLALKMENQLLQSPPMCNIFRQYPETIYVNQNVNNLDNYQKKMRESLLQCSKSP
jgi:hypothetical protein